MSISERQQNKYFEIHNITKQQSYGMDLKIGMEMCLKLINYVFGTIVILSSKKNKILCSEIA